MAQTIAVLDFGSQLTQVIARRIRECQVYSKIYPFATSAAKLREEGVVRIRGEAQTRYYSLADRIVRGTIHALCALSAETGS